jgi:hypothetical protein
LPIDIGHIVTFNREFAIGFVEAERPFFKNSSKNCFQAAACTRAVNVITPSRSKITASGSFLIHAPPLTE